MTKFSDYGRSL